MTVNDFYQRKGRNALILRQKTSKSQREPRLEEEKQVQCKPALQVVGLVETISSSMQQF